MFFWRKTVRKLANQINKAQTQEGLANFFLLLFEHSRKGKKDHFSEGNVVVQERMEIKFPNFYSTRNPLQKEISSVEQQEHF